MRTPGLFFFSLALAAAATEAAAQNDSDLWVRNCREFAYGDRQERHCEVRETRIPARAQLRVRPRSIGTDVDACRRPSGSPAISTRGTNAV